MRISTLTRSKISPQLLSTLPRHRVVQCHRGSLIYRTGDVADCVYYIQQGQVTLTRISYLGHESVIGLLSEGDFAGEACLIGEPHRKEDATCICRCSLLSVERGTMLDLLRRDAEVAEDFMCYLLQRTARYQDDLEDQLSHSTEQRVARALLVLARASRQEQLPTTVPSIDPTILAQLVGTTRPRVSELMSSFRRAGLIDYNRHEIVVRPSLLEVLMK